MTKLNEMAEEQMFDGHACLTGDCPHEKQRGCFMAVAKAAYLAALESSEVRDLETWASELKGQHMRMDDGKGKVFGPLVQRLNEALLAFRKMREGVG